MTILSVTDTAGLMAALASAQAGDVIELAAGQYGDVSLRDLNFATDVTIRSADPGAQATIHTVELYNVHNLVFDDLNIDYVPGADSVSWQSAVSIRSSSGISILNSNIEGGPSVNGVPQSTPVGGLDSTGNVIGLPTGRGVYAYQSNDIRLEGNDISWFHKGITLAQIDGIVIKDNFVHDLRTTPLSGGNLDNVFIDGNHFKPSAKPWNYSGAGDHGDIIHIWTAGASGNTFHIANNIFEQGDGTALLGIFLEADAGFGFTDVQIRNNLIVNGDLQGIRLEGTTDSIIENNTLLGTIDERTKGPTIVLDDRSVVTVRNNIYSGPPSDTLAGDNGNVLVQRYDTNFANYYGAIFVDAISGHGGHAGVQFLPGSPLADLLAGASFNRFDSTPEELTALIRARIDPDERGALSFDGSLTADSSGFVGANDATFSWDFGDGSTGTGFAVGHQYAAPGSYEVVLRVDRGGVVDEIKTTVVVVDPVILDLDLYTNGARDVSSYLSSVVGGALSDEQRSSSILSAHHLNESGAYKVAKENTARMFALEEFTLSFTLKRDSSTADTGDLMRLHGSWYVQLEKGGELSFQYADATNTTFEFTTSGANIVDAAWHSIDLVFDTDTGFATFYVDGRAVGQGAIGGATQTMEYWGFALGNGLSTGSAGAMIGSVRLLDEALGADEIVGIAPRSQSLGLSRTSGDDDSGAETTDAPAAQTPAVVGKVAISDEAPADGPAPGTNLGYWLDAVADDAYLDFRVDALAMAERREEVARDFGDLSYDNAHVDTLDLAAPQMSQSAGTAGGSFAGAFLGIGDDDRSAALHSRAPVELPAFEPPFDVGGWRAPFDYDLRFGEAHIV